MHDSDQERVDRLIDEYLTLREHVDKLDAELESVKQQLRELGEGEHVASDGTSVVVARPRVLDLDAAVELLTLAQRATSMTYNAAQVKRYLTPEQLEQCMREGTGKARVTWR